MSLKNYLAKSTLFERKILSDFSPAEVEQLYNLLREKGYKKHFAYVREHQKDILKYISQSPSRRKQKKWVNRQDALQFRFAAYQISHATSELLTDIQEIYRLVDKSSYREFHSQAAEGVADLLLRNFLAYFPSLEHKNPFLP